MDTPSSSMRDLAGRLLAVEAARQCAAGAHVHEAVRVCEKLQISLTRFAGSDGFKSLLRRALALARAEVPALQTVKLKPDGSLEGCEALAVGATNGGPVAAVAITSRAGGNVGSFLVCSVNFNAAPAQASQPCALWLPRSVH